MRNVLRLLAIFVGILVILHGGLVAGIIIIVLSLLFFRMSQ